MTPNKSKRHNFVGLTDFDLKFDQKYERALSPLLYLKVMRTKELAARSGTKHNYNNFLELIKRLRIDDYISTFQTSQFSQQYIYPTSKDFSQL